MTVADLIKSLQAVPHLSAEVRLDPDRLLVAAGDFTGGAAEDLFTLTAHGLVDGDRVQLVWESAAGVVTGAAGDVFYVEELSSSTFQLEDSAGATIENTADGTAIFVKVSAITVDTTGATDTGIQGDAPAVADIDPGFVQIG